MIRNKRYDPRDTKHQVKFDVLSILMLSKKNTRLLRSKNQILPNLYEIYKFTKSLKFRSKAIVCSVLGI